MRRTFKNELFQFLSQTKFGIDQFRFLENSSSQPGLSSVSIRYKETPLEFFIKELSGYNDKFTTSYYKYAQGFPLTTHGPNAESFQEVLQRIKNWLDGDVSSYIDDENTPDLWDEYNSYRKAVDLTNFDVIETEKFSKEESRQIALALGQMKQIIRLEYKTTEEQQFLVEEKLDYLIEAVDRLNKFDWKSTLFSTFLSILINLTVDTAKGAILFETLKQLLKHIPSISNAN